MGLLDKVKSMLGLEPGDQTKEVGKMAEKMTTEQVNEYMKQQCGFVPAGCHPVDEITAFVGWFGIQRFFCPQVLD